MLVNDYCIIFYVSIILKTNFIGLVSKVLPADTVLDQAIKTAEKIAEQAPLSVIMAKEAINTGLILFYLATIAKVPVLRKPSTLFSL